MRRTTMLGLSLVCGLVLVACSTTETTNNSNTSSTSSTAEKPATTSTPATTTASTSGDNIGVPECDDFITKYDACVSNKVPEMVRAQYKDAIARWRTEWRRMANDPATRGQLAAACKQAAEQQSAALKSFGCAF
ncbi:MAG TPA: hypothetical protein VFZ40_12355 [Pyrinomonadaceae bacterium]